MTSSTKLRPHDVCPYCLRRTKLFETVVGWGCDDCEYFFTWLPDGVEREYPSPMTDEHPAALAYTDLRRRS
jgi:hypothetical protein